MRFYPFESNILMMLQPFQEYYSFQQGYYLEGIKRTSKVQAGGRKIGVCYTARLD
jgi:hypothetical protein